jgi:raffinose/stachyose/melibiose transport system permease protein
MTSTTLTATAQPAQRPSAVPARRKTDRPPRWQHLILIPLAVIWLVPIVMVLGLSLMPPANPQTTGLGLLPQTPSLVNYVLIWKQNPILRHLINSLIIAVPSIVLVIIFGSMAAFALARLKVPFTLVFFGGLILALVLPMSSIVVATFQILQTLGLYNNLLGLVLVYTALGLPFAVIIIRTAYLAIPYETFEAGLVDGAHTWWILWRIYFPLGRPAMAVVIIWQTMMTWNDFLLPLVTLGDNELKPLTLVPLAYRGVFLSQPGALFAILVMISLPIVLVFLFVQRYLVSGLAGAIK